jgi:hypothetical protein
MTLSLGFFLGSVAGMSLGMDQIIRDMPIIKESEEYEERRRILRRHCFFKEEMEDNS